MLITIINRKMCRFNKLNLLSTKISNINIADKRKENFKACVGGKSNKLNN